MTLKQALRPRIWMIPPVAILAIAAWVAVGRMQDNQDAGGRLDRVEAGARKFTGGEVLITTAFKTKAGHLCGTFTTWGGPAGRDYGAFDESPEGMRIEVQSRGFSATDEGCVARTHDLAGLLEHRDAQRRHG